MKQIRLGDYIEVTERLDQESFFGQLVDIAPCLWARGDFLRLVDDAGNEVQLNTVNIDMINGTVVSELTRNAHGFMYCEEKNELD